MQRIKNIAQGWINFIKSKKPNGISPEREAIANQRARICQSCPFLQQKPYMIAGKTLAKFRCGKCGCAFPMMVYAPNKKCPINKWPQ
jgi:hypothetical protein